MRQMEEVKVERGLIFAMHAPDVQEHNATVCCIVLVHWRAIGEVGESCGDFGRQTLGDSRCGLRSSARDQCRERNCHRGLIPLRPLDLAGFRESLLPSLRGKSDSSDEQIRLSSGLE